MSGIGRLRAAVVSLLLVTATVFCVATARAMPPLEIYGNLPGLEMAAISPSGNHVAILGRVGTDRKLLLLDQGSKLIRHVSVGDIKIRGLYWAGDEMLLIERSNTTVLGPSFTANKAELTGMMVLPVVGDRVWQIFEKHDSITGGIRGFYGLNQRNGKWFGYFGGITLDRALGSMSGRVLQSTDPVLYEVDLQTRDVKKIAARIDDQMNWRTWLVDQDGNMAAALDYFSARGTWILRNGNRDEIASGTHPLGGIGLIGFGSTSDTVIYSVPDTERGADRWFEVPITGGGAKEILSDIASAYRIIDPQTRSLIGYQVEGDRPSYHFFDPHRQKVANAVLKAFPGVSVHLMDWNDVFDRLIVKTEGVGDPVTWWIVDVKTGKANIIGTSHPMTGDDVGPMKMIQYKAGDGLDIAAVLTLPPGAAARNLPVVVLPHGGPASRDYPGFDWWAQAFASRGYAVLQPNFRGSTGYGADFERAGDGQWGRAMQTDISDGLAYLVQQGIADPKRACIMGASYGGYAALAGVTLQQGLYRCAVSVAGVSDVAKMARTELEESGQNRTIRRALKQELGSGRDLSAVSPIRHAERADAPVLLVHGKDDTVVLYDQSNDMGDALRRTGKPVEMVTLDGEDHWLSKSETRLAMLKAALAFVEKHNPPGPVPTR